MRKPSEDDLSDDVADTGSIGDGFRAVVDVSDTYYGDSFDDDYTAGDDDAIDTDSRDASFDDDDVDSDETSIGADVSESEAEDFLEDMLDETYGSDADEVVQEMQDATGMTSVEILEDMTASGLGPDATVGVGALGAMDAGLEMLETYDDGPDTPELDMNTRDDFDLNRDGHIGHADLHEATHVFDFDIHDG